MFFHFNFTECLHFACGVCSWICERVNTVAFSYFWWQAPKNESSKESVIWVRRGGEEGRKTANDLPSTIFTSRWINLTTLAIASKFALTNSMSSSISYKIHDQNVKYMCAVKFECSYFENTSKCCWWCPKFFVRVKTSGLYSKRSRTCRWGHEVPVVFVP